MSVEPPKIPITDKEFEEMAKERGYRKKTTDDSVAIRTILLIWLSLIVPQIVIFLMSATFPVGVDGVAHWYMSPEAWQGLLVAVVQSFQVVVVGKVANYYEQRKIEQKLEKKS
jgi:hypothetical protein